MWSAGADAPPQPRWSPKPASLPPSPPASGTVPPWSPRIPQGSGWPSQFEVHSHGRRSLSAWSSEETRPICSWLAPGSSLAGSLSPSGHPGVAGYPRRCWLTQRHPRTRAGWRRGVPAEINGWVGGLPSHTPPSPVGIPWSFPPFWKGSYPSHHPPWSPVCPSCGSGLMQTACHWATQTALPTEWLCGYPHWKHCTRQWGGKPNPTPRCVAATGASPRGYPPQYPHTIHCKAVPSRRPPWPPPSSPPAHTFPASVAKSPPRLLAWTQGTFRGQWGAPTSVPWRIINV